jgi:murein L,D-transpeptidase YcbB/YkuD
MRGLRYDRILAGTAAALVLAAVTGAHAASTKSTVVAHKPHKVTTGVPAPAPQPTTTATNSTEVTGEPTGAVPAKAEAAPAAATPAAPAAAAPATAGETVAPEPFASLDPADRPIAEKIRELLAAKTDKIFSSKKEHTAVETFYQNRNMAPLWLEKGVASDRAKAAIARIKEADTDGLDVADYKIPDFAAASADALAEAELKLTETILTYARHVQAGRFSYASVSKNIELPQQPPEPSEVLAKLADAKDAGKALDEFSPPQKAYQALKARLAELRNKSGGNGNAIPDGQELKLTKVPMEDARVPQLRDRLGLKGDAADLHFDAKLSEAVKKYQRSNDLKVTGALDGQTIRDLNGPPRDKQIDIILANMERWRWIPRDLGKTHVMVNLPDFTLRLVHNGSMLWTTRIVIGKPAMPTPMLTETMKYITVNPTWNVPQSIVQNEYLPALAQDPTVLERMGLHVVNDRDGSVHIYQPPGDGNALGRLRFNFPNRFDVYQHDTPEKYLFNETSRAYSHGCMRVQDPVKYAQLLLSIERPNEGYTEDKIRRLFGHDEQDIQFPAPIPVHLTYQTATVEDDGQLVIRRDVYGLDSRVISLIKTERGMIDVATKERDRDAATSATASARKPIRQPQPQSGGFFQALFGGGPPPPVGRPPSRIR